MKKATLFSLVILMLVSIQSCTVDEDTTAKNEITPVNVQNAIQEIDPGKIKPPTGG